MRNTKSTKSEAKKNEGFEVFYGNAYVKPAVDTITLWAKQDKAIEIARSVFGLDMFPGVHTEAAEEGYASLINDYLDANTETKGIGFEVIETEAGNGLSYYSPSYKA